MKKKALALLLCGALLLPVAWQGLPQQKDDGSAILIYYIAADSESGRARGLEGERQIVETGAGPEQTVWGVLDQMRQPAGAGKQPALPSDSCFLKSSRHNLPDHHHRRRVIYQHGYHRNYLDCAAADSLFVRGACRPAQLCVNHLVTTSPPVYFLIDYFSITVRQIFRTVLFHSYNTLFFAGCQSIPGQHFLIRRQI